eukprot:6225948-Heterocapsa_arctica.AAC.1
MTAVRRQDLRGATSLSSRSSLDSLCRAQSIASDSLLLAGGEIRSFEALLDDAVRPVFVALRALASAGGRLAFEGP